MPVGVTVKDMYCESCDGTTKQTIKTYHVENKVIRQCHLCKSTYTDTVQKAKPKKLLSKRGS